VGLQDRDYIKHNREPKTDSPWSSIQPEPIELESYRSRKKPINADPIPLWAQIMFGILAAAIVMFVTRELYTRYQLYQFQKYMEQQTRIMQQETQAILERSKASAEESRRKMELQQRQREAQMQAKANAQAEARRQQALFAAQQKKLQSDKCRFWTDNYSTYGTDKAKEMMDNYCTISGQ